ncbi:MAG: Asp23/Gls24 family envelope stress response protein [Waddliaceae bacterium]
MEKKKKTGEKTARVDTEEFELPETVYVRDIENRVFQGIVLHCLGNIKGITLVEGNFIDNILGRDSLEGIRGIHTEQDSNRPCVNIRVEVNICYGISIPDKAEEIQTKITEEVTKLTGLHVASIHIVFKNIVSSEQTNTLSSLMTSTHESQVLINSDKENDYTDEF